MSPNIFVVFAAASAAWATLGSNSHAQTEPAPPPQTVLEQVLACGKIEDDQGRLACFDAAVTQLTPTKVSGG